MDEKDIQLYCMQQLQAARKQAGWSQATVGAQLGVSAGVISDWETGRRVLTAADVVRFAAVYQLPVSALLPPTASGPARELEQLFAQAPVEAREPMVQFLLRYLEKHRPQPANN